MPEVDLKLVSINWNRSILIHEAIDDDLLKKITPTILSLRQESDDPITVGIDSLGGSISTLEAILALLTGPTQDKKRGRIITVVTNRAYSAAASFLALGSYAVALPHSKILYHDVRYGGMEDVTPAKARDAADALQDVNDSFSLRLARPVIQRLIWVYIDMMSNFGQIQKKWPNKYANYSKIVDLFSPQIDGKHSADLASFATSLFAALSLENEGLISTVMEQLGNWIGMTNLIRSARTYRQKGSRVPGLLDGARYLNTSLVGKNPSKSFEKLEEHLKLLVGLLVVRLSEPRFRDGINFSSLIEQALRDLKLIESMDDVKHEQSATRLMLENDLVFFGKKITKDLEGKSEEEKDAILAAAAPQARLFWCFSVLLCRELFRGDHILSPRDAQVLGLIDEIAGGGPVESFREYRVRRSKEKAEGAAAKDKS